MNSLLRAIMTAGALTAVSLPAGPAPGATRLSLGGGNCLTYSIGVDTAGANIHLYLYVGRAYGQVFSAQDTLILSRA